MTRVALAAGAVGLVLIGRFAWVVWGILTEIGRVEDRKEAEGRE